MSRRQYPVADLYEERERDYYRGGPRSSVGGFADEIDVDITRSRTADPYTRQQPAFMTPDYGRTSAGPLVVRGPPPRAREIEREELIVRDRAPPAPRERIREDIDINIRRDDRSDSRPAPRSVRGSPPRTTASRSVRGSPTRGARSVRGEEIEREEFTFRRAETAPAPPPPRPREYEPEITFRTGGGAPPTSRAPPRREVEREEVVFKEERIEERPRERSVERERIVIRPRERSLPPPVRGDLVAREREEVTITRRRPSPSPSPSPPPMRSRSRERVREEIVIRRTERSPTPPPPPPPPPPAPEPEPEVIKLEPIIRPPIHQEIIQEIITHHRHIDHGIIRARSPTPPPPREPTPPPPPPPPQVREEQLEIEIRRRDNRGHYEREEIFIDREGIREAPAPKPAPPPPPPAPQMEETQIAIMHRSQSPPARRRDEFDIEIDYSRKTTDNYSRRRSLPPPEPKKPKDMWTEVTKDLVIRDAVEAMGYQYEETEEFFYIMEYLKYEDVLQLVEITEDIRRERQKRIRELEWERERLEREEIIYTREKERKPKYDERYYEREVVYDSRRGRH